MINHGVGTPSRRVAPFGHTRIISCLPIPARFRGLPRPSSPPEAKASSVRPSFLPFCESLITPTGLPDGATALSFVCLREIAALNVFLDSIRKDLQSLLLLLSLCTLYFVLSASMRSEITSAHHLVDLLQYCQTTLCVPAVRSGRLRGQGRIASRLNGKDKPALTGTSLLYTRRVPSS